MRVRVRAILKYRKIHRLTNLAPPLLTVSFCLWNTSRCREIGGEGKSGAAGVRGK